MMGIKNVVLLSIAALAQIGSCTPTGQIEPPIPEVCNIAQHPILSFTNSTYSSLVVRQTLSGFGLARKFISMLLVCRATADFKK